MDDATIHEEVEKFKEQGLEMGIPEESAAAVVTLALVNGGEGG